MRRGKSKKTVNHKSIKNDMIYAEIVWKNYSKNTLLSANS